MTLNPIRANMTELESNGMKILFSYKIPVAVKVGGLVYITAKKWSNTTTRHINQWTGGIVDFKEPQEYFDNLISEVK